MSTTPSDPMEFLKSLWGNTGMPLPGLVTPTLDTNELDKRIADLKAVEGWLKTNLSMLQMTIQGLDMQRATLSAIHAISQSTSNPDPNANSLANLALWPWNLLQGASQSFAAGTAGDSPAAKDPAPAKSGDKPA